MGLRQILEALNSQLQQASATIRQLLDELTEATPVTAPVLGPTPDFNDPEWPEAAPTSLIIKSEHQKRFRASQIIDRINLTGQGARTNQVMLDFGCEEGHLTYELSHIVKKVVGYDPVLNPGWTQRIADNLFYTDNHEVLSKHAPYDAIILWDVLDHIVEVAPVVVLQQLKELLDPKGTIFIRTHPWTCRHGGHLYEQHNKAFLHLLLTEDELQQAGWQSPYQTQKLARPMGTYETWFKQAGLTVSQRRVVAHPEVEAYFDQHLERMAALNWPGQNLDQATIKKIIVNNHIDYWLVRP